MAHSRDYSELQRALETHSVVWYPVLVPIFGRGHITSQANAGAFIYYGVEGDKSIPFAKWIDKKGIDTERLDLKGWEDRYWYGSRKMTGSGMQYELKERLERGGIVSPADVEYADLKARGCMDEEEMVHCNPFDSRSVQMDPKDLKSGMLIEVEGTNYSIHGRGQTDVWPARVVTVSGSDLLLDLLVPLTYLRMPDLIDSKKIKPGYHSKKTVAFGEGLVQAWTNESGEFDFEGRKLPPGEWSEDKKEYLLNEPLESDVLEEFCKENFPDEPHCLWQGLLMYVIPVKLGKRDQYSLVARPLPENSVPVEYVRPPIEE